MHVCYLLLATACYKPAIYASPTLKEGNLSRYRFLTTGGGVVHLAQVGVSVPAPPKIPAEHSIPTSGGIELKVVPLLWTMRCLPVKFTMFCHQCRVFCGEAVTFEPDQTDSTANKPKWKPHRSVLHASLSELKRAASDNQCQICRLIWHSLGVDERSRLAEDFSTILEVNTSDRGMPVLSAQFDDSVGQLILPKRMVAMYAGEVGSGRLIQLLRVS